MVQKSPDALNCKQVSQILNLSVARIYQLLNEGQLISARYAGKKMITKQSVDAYQIRKEFNQQYCNNINQHLLSIQRPLYDTKYILPGNLNENKQMTFIFFDQFISNSPMVTNLANPPKLIDECSFDLEKIQVKLGKTLSLHQVDHFLENSYLIFYLYHCPILEIPLWSMVMVLNQYAKNHEIMLCNLLI